MRIGALAALLIGAAAPAAHAQRLAVSGGGTVTIGDTVTLALRATLPAGAVPDGPPHPRDSLPSSVRLLDVQPLRGAGDSTVAYRARIALYQTGSLTSPAFALTYHLPQEERTDSVVSGAVLVTVMATLPDTASVMRDIRPLAPLGGASSWPWWIVLIVALAVATVVALVVRARGRARHAIAAVPVTAPPPGAYDAARIRLDEIRRAGWATTDVARHYEAAADVLRGYLARAHGVPAVHRTTSELLRELPGTLTDGGELAALLGEADLVKFARLRPPPRPALAFLDRVAALLDRWHAAEPPGTAEPVEAADAVR